MNQETRRDTGQWDVDQPSVSQNDTCAEVRLDELPRVGSKWCEYEKRAIEIRRLVGVRYDERFQPEMLAKLFNFRIIGLSQLDGLPLEIRQILVKGDQWSGAAIRPASSDPGDLSSPALIIVNDTHSRRRQRATVMEEICHLILGHPPSTIHDHGRTFNARIEEEAYAIGAATLLPYRALSEALFSQVRPESIALRFDVSRQLVSYRCRVTGLGSIHDTLVT